MTLFKQLYSLLFGLFLLVVTTLVLVQFSQTRSFLINQMESDLNNASHALALMLAPAVESGDDAAAQTLVNVIFEGGYYQHISLTWLQDGRQQHWENPVAIRGVPDWFTELGLFPTLSQETTITAGWLQLASLKITASPSFGYVELWQVISRTLLLVSLFFLLAILLARIGLRWILSPLHQLIEQTQTIAKGRFNPALTLPHTQELRPLVQAFNHMSQQLQQLFHSLDEEVTALREKNLIDRVSALPNRQYLDERLTDWLDNDSPGAVMLLKMPWLEQVYRQFGYQVRDDAIRQLSAQLSRQLSEQQFPPSVITRIAAYEFALLITQADQAQLEHYLETLLTIINHAQANTGSTTQGGLAIGIARRQNAISASELLAQADHALQQAGNNQQAVSWYDTSQQVFTKAQWRQLISQAVAGENLSFRWQTIHSYQNNHIMQRELYCLLQLSNGQQLSAAQFIPYVELLAQGVEVDKHLIKKIFSQRLVQKQLQPLAVNLTLQSIRDSGFHQWLQAFLNEADNVERLCFELPEAIVYSDPQACATLVAIIRATGAKFGVDHFGRQLGSLQYLQQLRPDYLKLDQSFAHYDDKQHNAELCRALLNVARGLNIAVIITGIENNQQLEGFRDLAIQGYQGYIHPPVDIEEQ